VSDTPRSLELGGLVGEKYRLLKKIGEGGHGRVYRAINLLLGREVAVKVLRPDMVRSDTAKKRFFREARTANLVRHPNVVDVLDVGDSPEGPWMVQELLVGESLATLLARERILSVDRTLELLLPILSALATAHARGIAHRDFKPENVFLVRESDGTLTPKILDFGLSKPAIELSGPQSSEPITGTGVVVGTPAYLSPERVRMESEGDHLGDVWSIGVVLYECTTGFLPFPAKKAKDMFAQVANREPTPITDVRPQIDPAFAQIVMRCLRPPRGERFASAGEVEESIRRLLDERAPPDPNRRRPQPGSVSQTSLRALQRPSAPPIEPPVATVPETSAGAAPEASATVASSAPPPGDGRPWSEDFHTPEDPPTSPSDAALAALEELVPAPGATPRATIPPASEPDPLDREPPSYARWLVGVLSLVALALAAQLWPRSPSPSAPQGAPAQDR
jgi:serine/threonine protein kinase